MQKVYWAKFRFKMGTMYSAATEKGLCYIGSPDAPFAELELWVHKRFKVAQLIEDEGLLQPYQVELTAYMEKECKEFSMPLDLYGTDFQRNVWKILQEIPYGETCSYMDIAEKIGNPRSVRAVGGAIGKNPVLIAVPCHRVITKDGKLGGFRAGLSMKKQLLSLESSEKE